MLNRLECHVILTIVGLMTATLTSGCSLPAESDPGQNNLVVASTNPGDTQVWVGKWGCTVNNIIYSQFITIERSGDGLKGTYTIVDGTKITPFELREIVANAESFTASFQDPEGSIIVGDLYDQVSERIYDSRKKYPKKTWRLLLQEDRQSANERWLIDGNWYKHKDDFVAWVKKNAE
jgi:hypothetical protein